jgi:hypothetical protein
MDQQPQLRTLQSQSEPAPSTSAGTGFRWSAVWYVLVLGLSGAALIDASIETAMGPASTSIRVAAPLLTVVLFGVLALCWKRIRLDSKALAATLSFLVLIAGTAWLPGGLEKGISIARQPTSTLLEAISAFAVVSASILFLRLRAPVWLRGIGVALGIYGLAAYVLAMLAYQPFFSLFQGQSFWNHLPLWAQGAWIGAVLIPIAVVADFLTFFVGRNHPKPPLAWRVDLSLAIAAVVLAAGFASRSASGTSSETASRFASSKSMLDLVHYAVSGDRLTDTDLALDENGGAIEAISGVMHKGRGEDVPASFCGGGLNGKRLIDGRLEPTWAGDPQSDPAGLPHPAVLPVAPFEIVISFYRHQSALIGAVSITPGKDLNRAPKDVEISVSGIGPSDGFQNVASVTLPGDSGEQNIRFTPVQTSYVKIRVLSTQGTTNPENTAAEIAEVRVFEVERKGYVSLRDRSPDLPDWKVSPRYAAQHGINWLQPAAIGWGTDKDCFGCHIQSQAAMGLTLAAKNDYLVSRNCVRDLADLTAKKQKDDGSFNREEEGSTVFAAMGLAYWDDLGGIQNNRALLKSVDYLLTKQKDTGEMPYGQAGCNGLAVVQGSIMATANSLVAFDRAFAETRDVRYKAAADRALTWLAAAHPTAPEGFTTQDKVFKILALARFGTPEQRPAIQDLVEQLVRDQKRAGGWSECGFADRQPTAGDWAGFKEPNPFSTGQVLYAFKQAGMSTNSSPFLKGVQYLLKTQREDGSWPAYSQVMHTMGAPYAPTMWAVIGLAGSFGHIRTGGLQIVAEADPAKAAAARNLEIILDVSGSMMSKLGKSTRIGTARQVLQDVLAKLPDDFNVGLRVYAHRYSYKDVKQSCTDTELLVPIQKLDRSRIMSSVDHLKPRGDTPLFYSLRQTPGDLRPAGGGSVIVITDGQETCSGDQEHTRQAAEETARELKDSGIPETVNIVGFTLQGTEKKQAEQVMPSLAQATGGRYYYAEDGPALSRALSLAALNKFPYAVLDARGQQVAQGQAGPLSEALPPGTYKVIVHAEDQELTQQVTLSANKDTILRIVRQGQQFALVGGDTQNGPPVKQVATGQVTP